MLRLVLRKLAKLCRKDKNHSDFTVIFLNKPAKLYIILYNNIRND